MLRRSPGKPNTDLSIKYARFPHSPQQLSSQTQRNSMGHPIYALPTFCTAPSRQGRANGGGPVVT
jgi:hypothetical protein